MTFALVALAALVVVALVYALDRKDKQMAAERDQWREERRELLLRIQAPEQAVIQQIVADAPSPPAVGWDDDQDYWAAQQETKEQLADRMAREERELREMAA